MMIYLIIRTKFVYICAGNIHVGEYMTGQSVLSYHFSHELVQWEKISSRKDVFS